MSGNFVHCKRERQRIAYIYNIHVYYICKQYAAARAYSARNFPTFLIIYVNNTLPLALTVHEISRHFWAAYEPT